MRAVLFLFLLGPLSSHAHALVVTERSFDVAIFPTLNETTLEVWESKYYPVDILRDKITAYLVSLFKEYPYASVRVLDEAGARRWLDEPGSRFGAFAVQLELYRSLTKEREVLGSWQKGQISLRMRVYDPVTGRPSEARNTTGTDTRFTFNPGDDRLFFLSARGFSLFDVLYKDGIDLLRLTPGDKGQKMSRPTWKQFEGSTYWQACKNAVKGAFDDIMKGYNGYRVMGRIISPTADATRKKREYIITLGRENSLLAGDILQVVQSDKYVTVDPENPVIILPRVVGNVKVTFVKQSEAVVRLVNEDPRNPVQLNDLVAMPLYGPRKAAPLK